MPLIKLFTIVKDEIDIVNEWVHYHGKLFGYENLHIIDNGSSDGTYERLVDLQKYHGCVIIQLQDYRMKGVYMSRLIMQYCEDTAIAYPLDIDEFIAHYDKTSHSISCDKPKLLSYFEDVVLPMIANKQATCFKANYVISKIIGEATGYTNAVLQCSHGAYADYKKEAKTFFSARYIIDHNITIDHGNHFTTGHYFLTDLVLVHYHARSYDQMVKKVYNNVSGFGYPVHDAKLLEAHLGHWNGHHVKYRIDMLNGAFRLDVEEKNPDKPCSDTHISLSPIIESFSK